MVVTRRQCVVSLSGFGSDVVTAAVITVTNPFQKYLIEFFSSHHAEHHHYVIILPLAVHACEACETEMGHPEEVVAGTG